MSELSELYDRAINEANRRHLESGYITFEMALRYQEWLIYHNTVGYGGRYAFVHESYDGPGDDRLGTGDTIEACILQINEKILEEIEETPPAG